MDKAVSSKHINNRRYAMGRWWDNGFTLITHTNYVARVYCLGVGTPGESPFNPGVQGQWFYGTWSHSTQYSRSRVRFTEMSVEAPF